jgi:hypothetical protein
MGIVPHVFQDVYPLPSILTVSRGSSISKVTDCSLNDRFSIPGSDTGPVDACRGDRVILLS